MLSRLSQFWSWPNILGLLLISSCLNRSTYISSTGAPKFDWGEKPYEAAIRIYEKAHAVVLSETCKHQAQYVQFEVLPPSELIKLCISNKVAACMYNYEPRGSGIHVAILEEYAGVYSIRTHETLHAIVACENEGEQPGASHSDVVWAYVPSSELPPDSPWKPAFGKIMTSASK